ncbi:MAG: carbohydrate porin, partial [Vampirovibrionales bacterium]|nr:carbohydrate porin [Vampirovibrionales bacterium]
NASFVNTPGIAVNLNQPMVAMHWNHGLGEYLNADVTTGVGVVNQTDALTGLNVTYEGRLNYKTGLQNWLASGSIYGGGYHVFMDGHQLLNSGSNVSKSDAVNRAGNTLANAQNRDTTNAFYVGWNQDWFKGIGTTVNYMQTLGNANSNRLLTSTNQNVGFSNTSATLVGVRQALTAVLNIPMSAVLPAGWRDGDALGIGYGFLDLYEDGLSERDSNGNLFKDRLEQVMEVYYRWQVNDKISVIPSFQLINSGGGIAQNDVYTVVGLRSSYVF